MTEEAKDKPRAAEITLSRAPLPLVYINAVGGGPWRDMIRIALAEGFDDGLVESRGSFLLARSTAKALAETLTRALAEVEAP